MPEGRNVFVEFHALTSHSPSNLNRDDLGTPKTAIFGGVRRLRISSQCLKRTWRLSPQFRTMFEDDQLGIRTAQLPEILLDELKGDITEQARAGLMALLASVGRSSKEKEEASSESEGEDAAGEQAGAGEAEVSEAARTAHIIWLTRRRIEAIKDFVRKNGQALESLSAPKGKGRRGGAKPDKDKLKEVRQGLKNHLATQGGRNPVDEALFGSFMTSDEFKSVSAAMQVAHALGTQKVDVEYDYFSAMDDKSDEPGAGLIGEAEFAASVFYKYAVCDLGLLNRNLDRDKPLAARALKAVAIAIARSVPSGKKNSTAPQNPADYLEVVVRKDAPISLANAFLEPVRRTSESDDVMTLSIARLRQLGRRYEEAYSQQGDVLARFVMCLKEAPDLDSNRCSSLKDLSERLERLLSTLAAN
jgi:CRISPR system Cascade subunit CasC